jgi:phospholipid/cholesterol/gamma-HCH transport system permease protein
LLDFLKPPIESFQDFIIMSGRALRNIFRSPHYGDDILLQMDIMGVGSLPIVMLIGLFSGLIMGLQMGRALTTYGAQGQIGEIVSFTLIRELGPVLVALLAPCASPNRSTRCGRWAPIPFRN